ncbi:MAG: M48 family metallopeptidase [Acidaminococcaceae bacterium]
MKKVMQCGDKLLEFEVVRSRRRTLAIAVETSACVVVRAPMTLSAQKILEIVEQKADWINNKLAFWQKAQDEKLERENVQGKSLLYLGQYYSLQLEVMPGLKKDSVSLEAEKIVVQTGDAKLERIEKALNKWYRERAQELITQRVLYYGRFFDGKPSAVQIKEQKKRWGSCTYNNKLLFNWRCIMARREALDYVVVHEMSHMVQKNHSPAFWQIVETIMPEYKLEKKWLKENVINMDL